MANLGVDYGQGFAIGKPVPLSEVLQDLSLYELVAAGDGTIGAEIDFAATFPALAG